MITPTEALTPPINPVYIDQIMRVVIEAMPNAPALVALVAPSIQVTLVVTTPVDNVVLLVQMV